jgi:hypothetical protein
VAVALPARLLTATFTLCCLATPLAAQNQPQGQSVPEQPVQGATGAPIDPAEANAGSDVAALRIGGVVISGSFHGDAIKVNGDPDDAFRDEFRIRRARLGAAGNLTPKIGWNFSAELTTSPVLRNAFVLLRLHRALNVRVGQATVPSSIERNTSPTVIEFIDRTRITTQLTYANEVGVSIFNETPFHRRFSYALSVVNGAGPNRSDNNDAKDVVGRVEVIAPKVRQLVFVATAATGRQPTGERTRNTVGGQYDGHTVKLAAEALRERVAGVTRDGFYGSAVYRLRPRKVTPHFRMVELVARFMTYDDPLSAKGVKGGSVDEDAGGSTPIASVFIPVVTRELQAGGNYYVNRNVRFTFNVVRPLGERTTPGTSLIARTQIIF